MARKPFRCICMQSPTWSDETSFSPFRKPANSLCFPGDHWKWLLGDHTHRPADDAVRFGGADFSRPVLAEPRGSRCAASASVMAIQPMRSVISPRVCVLAAGSAKSHVRPLADRRLLVMAPRLPAQAVHLRAPRSQRYPDHGLSNHDWQRLDGFWSITVGLAALAQEIRGILQLLGWAEASSLQASA